MTKTKQVHKTAGEAKEELTELAEQGVDKMVAEQLQVIMEKHGRALQPFLVSGEMGIVPRVRLVRIPAVEQPNETV